jgi:hypothetical protein
MGDYVVAIPTHNRSDVIQEKTFPLLKRLGISSNKIHLFVSTKEQERIYLENVPKSLYGKLIYRPANDVGGMKNKIFQYFPNGQHIVIIEDDIDDLLTTSRDGKKLVSLKNLDSLIRSGFQLCKENSTILWGIYAVTNAFFMSNKVSRDLKFIIGTLFGIINDKNIKLHTRVKEDYELSLIVFKKYGSLIRFNNIVAKRKNYPDKGHGGLDDIEERRRRTEVAVDYLLKKYPEYVVENEKRGTGLREISLRRVKSVLDQ